MTEPLIAWQADLDPSDPLDRVLIAAILVASSHPGTFTAATRMAVAHLGDTLRDLDAWTAEASLSVVQRLTEWKAWQGTGTDPIELGM